ncbi:MAG: hypothetical protein FWC32_13930 [Firmicutes bacterium]|nr:hypothetical protein [Bacillota bacterium]
MLNLPSIGFPGNCHEAITFYKEALGAEVKTIVYNTDRYGICWHVSVYFE